MVSQAPNTAAGGELLKLTGSDDWVKLNAGQLGFYRVTYPPQIWAALARAAARSDRADSQGLGPIDVAGLVEDSFALAEAGELSIHTHLELLRHADQGLGRIPRV